MGRKNTNARSRARYNSFADLKSSTVRFDLSKGNFRTKGYKTTAANNRDEINISLVKKGKPSNTMCVSFSIRKDIAEKMIKEGGKTWTCGVVQEGIFERLYIIPDEYGYSLFTNDHGLRYYTKIPTDEMSAFEKFAGKHRVQYDEYNKAWYVTVLE